MAELRLQIRDVRGRTLDIAGSYLLAEYAGLGPVPAEHITERGAFQIGETFRGGVQTARTVTLAIDIIAESLDELWQTRGELTRWMAALNQGCYLVWTLPDGSVREVFGRYYGAPGMDRRASMGPLYQRCVFSIRCPDPVVYDPTAVLWAYSISSGSGHWGFPLAFAAGFGVSTIDVTEAKAYSGSLPASPVITVVGPAANLVIENMSTGELLDLTTYEIAGEETVTIDCRYGHKTVTSSLAGNIIASMSADSDLGSFHIAPDPEVVDGVNMLHIVLTEGSSATRVYLNFYTQYNGLHL